MGRRATQRLHGKGRGEESEIVASVKTRMERWKRAERERGREGERGRQRGSEKCSTDKGRGETNRYIHEFPEMQNTSMLKRWCMKDYIFNGGRFGMPLLFFPISTNHTGL